MMAQSRNTRWMRRLVVVAAVSLCLALSPLASASAQSATNAAKELSNAFTSVAKEAIPAVVSIKVEKTVEVSGGGMANPFAPFNDDFLRRFFGGGGSGQQQQQQQQEYTQEGQGSGFIISHDGYILTNNHVVGDVDKITVELQDGRTFDNAKVIGTDPDSEVALIKIEGDDFPVLPLGDSNKLEIGDWVVAVGNPFGLSETVTVGVVSAIGRSDVRIANYNDFIQTDAAINPGNSGGPLINLDGEAIGINTAIYSQSGGYMGIGFAIPMSMARPIAEQLRTTGKVVRGYLGINGQDIQSDMVGPLGLDTDKGVIITTVVDGTPAEKAGLKDNDIIVDLNGTPVDSFLTFRNEIAGMAPGKEIHLTILRDGHKRDVNVTLAELPKELAKGGQPTQSRPSQQALGVQVQNLTRDLAQQFGYPLKSGVLVTAVQPGSPAARVGLADGDLIRKVNKEAVTSVDEFESAMAAVKGDIVVLLVQRDQASQYVTIELKR